MLGTCIGATTQFGEAAKGLIGISGIMVGIGEIVGKFSFLHWSNFVWFEVTGRVWIHKCGLSHKAEDCSDCCARTVASDGPLWCFWEWLSILLLSI